MRLPPPPPSPSAILHCCARSSCARALRADAFTRSPLSFPYDVLHYYNIKFCFRSIFPLRLRVSPYRFLVIASIQPSDVTRVLLFLLQLLLILMFCHHSEFDANFLRPISSSSRKRLGTSNIYRSFLAADATQSIVSNRFSDTRTESPACDDHVTYFTFNNARNVISRQRFIVH